MAFILETKNVFEPHRVEKTLHSGGISIWQFLKDRDPNFTEFETPTICGINGTFVKREKWDHIIQKDDVVHFVALPPQDVFWVIAIVIAVVVIAASVAFALTMQPTTPGELPTSDPVFSTKGQQNTIRPGEPIEVCYGRNRIYPSFATRPYFSYIDNQQYQHAVFCLGQGYYEIEQLLIGDTDIDTFDEVEYEIVEPGGDITIFPTSVYTSVEAGGQTIYASNEPEYVAPGYEGPFPANPAGTLITQIQVDLAFPKGLFRMNDDGEVRPAQIEVEIEYQEIDDVGSPLGAWTGLTSPFPFTFIMTTVTPQRRTVTSGALTAGRYQVRIKRNTIKQEGQRNGHEIMWESLKGFAQESQNWGDVTLWAVRIQASSNLNDQTQVRFNAIATRKLPVIESGGWSSPIATRSIVWALVDVFKASYGGRITDTFLDLYDHLIELDALYESRNEHFDWIFRDRITVWDAARAIARVGRAIPLVSGSLVTMKRDAEESFPVMVFTPDNIVRGSFSQHIKMWEVNEYDSLRAAYIDPNTGYKEETVLAALPGGTTDNPEDVRIPGIQDRNHAYREALYTLAVKKYLRKTYVFDTGMEGYIGSYGDLILVAHDVIRSPHNTGYIVASEYISGSEHRIYLSESLDWSEVGTKVMILRDRHGMAWGPFSVTEVSGNPMQALIAAGASNFDFFTGGDTEPMLFVFGVGTNLREYMKVVRVEPQGGEIVRITCVNYNADVYGFDDESEGPGLPPGQSLPPSNPPLQAPTQLIITQLDGVTPTVQVYWPPVIGANRYIIQTSIDGVTWTDQGEQTQTGAVLPVGIGDLYVRVAPVSNEGVGPYRTEFFDVLGGLGLIVLREWDDLSWGVGWLDAPNVMDWVVRVYDNSESEPILKQTYTRTWERRLFYAYDDAQLDDNISREHRVEVQGRYIDDSLGTLMAHNFSNEIPGPPTGMASEIPSGGETATQVVYHLTWTNPAEADLIRVKVWLSDTNGFDYTVVSPVYDDIMDTPGSDNVPEETYVVVPLTAGAHAAQYWRVGVFDVWGNELSTNVSAQQTIAAYP